MLQTKKQRKIADFSKYFWCLGGWVGGLEGDYSDWKLETISSRGSRLVKYMGANLACDMLYEPYSSKNE